MLFDAVAQATRGAWITVDGHAPANLPTEQPLAGLRLLVVEDNPLNQQVARELLSHAGAEIEVASDGKQGIACVPGRASLPYDAILMDIQMPGMDGTATRVLRQEMPVATPIIAMTANALNRARLVLPPVCLTISAAHRGPRTDRFGIALLPPCRHSSGCCPWTSWQLPLPDLPPSRKASILRLHWRA